MAAAMDACARSGGAVGEEDGPAQLPREGLRELQLLGPRLAGLQDVPGAHGLRRERVGGQELGLARVDPGEGEAAVHVGRDRGGL